MSNKFSKLANCRFLIESVIEIKRRQHISLQKLHTSGRVLGLYPRTSQNSLVVRDSWIRSLDVGEVSESVVVGVIVSRSGVPARGGSLYSSPVKVVLVGGE